MSTIMELAEKLLRTADQCERLARNVQAITDAMRERADRLHRAPNDPSNESGSPKEGME